VKTIEQARAVFKEAFSSDPEFRHVYLCTIAMTMCDAQPQGSRGLNMRKPEVRNALADRILKVMLE
jgi:hypothetical protein